MALSQASPAPLLLREFYENNVYKVADAAQSVFSEVAHDHVTKQSDDRKIVQKKSSDKPREKASALCKTPPTLIRSKNNGAEFYRGVFLGEGGFARCFEVRDELGNVYAAKTVAKASLTSVKTRAKLLGEIKVHQSMDHPNVVKFIECFEDDVNVRRKRFTEPEARYFLIQILGAVKYLHGRRVIHRDLKLGNIFLDQNMNIKIGDFGLAALLLSDTDRKKTICGTPNYIAPEVLFGKEDGHSFEVDLWSVGIILYAMLIGKPPFQSKEVNLIYKKIKAIEYEFPADVVISAEAKGLIQALLNKDPNARPSLDEIVDHPFFHGSLPSSLPSTCLEGVPHWKNLSPAISRRNYSKLTAAAGIGAGSGDGGLISRGAGHPISILNVDSTEKVDTALATKLGKPSGTAKVLPDCLSPKVSTTNIRQIVSSVATDYQKVTTAKMILRSSRSKPLSDLPINKPIVPSQPAATNSPILRRARRIGNPGNTDVLEVACKPAAVKDYGQNESNLKADKDIDVLANRHAAFGGISQRESLAETVENLTRALQGNDLRESSDTHNPINLYVSQWVDYSNKYGMGYQLSNGVSGVYFNDSSSIVMTRDAAYFDYITDPNKSLASRHSYNIDNVPQSLAKKVYLVRHFREYMSQYLYTGNEPSHVSEKSSQMSFMSDYIRTKQAIMFRLATGEIQFNFLDHYKIILADRGRRMRMIDPSRSVVEMPLTQMIHRAKRVKKTESLQGTCSNNNDEQLLQRLDFIRITLAGWLSRARAD